MRPITVTVSNAATEVKYSDWVRFDDWGPSYVSIQAVVGGDANYTIQTTLDDPNSPTNPVAVANVTWFDTNDSSVVGASSSAQSNFFFAPTFARVKLNSGTGSVTTTFLQSDGVPL